MVTALSASQKRYIDSQLQSNPLDFIRNGFYRYSSGGFGSLNSEGYYWEANPDSITAAKYLYFGSTFFNPQNALNKGYGFSLRCLVR